MADGRRQALRRPDTVLAAMLVEGVGLEEKGLKK